jgi:TonB family protein
MRPVLLLACISATISGPSLGAHERCSDALTLVEAGSPHYPESARLARMHGAVTLTLTLSRGGEVSDVGVTNGINPLLDHVAVTALKAWRFAPLGKDDAPNLTVFVNFVLGNEWLVQFYPPCEITVEGVAPVLETRSTSSRSIRPKAKK